MTYAFILNMLMEQGLELMALISTDSVDAKGKPLDHVIFERDGVRLGMSPVDFQRQHVRLDVVARHLLGIAAGVNSPTTDVSR